MDNLRDKIANSPHIRWYILANTTVGVFMATLDASIVNVALPTLSNRFQIDISLVQWVVTAYLLTIVSLLLIAGRLGDLVGRKRVYTTGFVIFTFGSLLCGIADSISVLILARVTQAIGASCLMALNQSIVVSSFDPSERGKALGINGVVNALGSLTGPALGGLLMSVFTWRAIFYINLPIGIAAYLAAQVILPNDTVKKSEERFDFSGAFIFAAGMVSLLYGINSAELFGWSSPVILLCLGLSVILISSFIIMEKRVEYPMVDLALYKIPAFAIGSAAALIAFFLNTALTVLYPFYLQQVLNYPIGKVGLIMASFPLVMLIVSPISGYLSDKIGPVILTSSGLALNCVGYLFLTTLTAAPGYTEVIAGPVLIGIGQAMFAAPNNSSVMGSVPIKKLGIAGGLNALVRTIGYALGATFAVSLFTSRKAALLTGLGNNANPVQQTSAFISAYHTVALAAAVIAFVGVIISLSRTKIPQTEV